MRLLANPNPVPSLSGYKLEVTGYKPYTPWSTLIAIEKLNIFREWIWLAPLMIL
jgi:hypothetical protein